MIGGDHNIRPRFEISLAECREWLEMRDENQVFDNMSEDEIVQAYNPDAGGTFKPFVDLLSIMQ